MQRLLRVYSICTKIIHPTQLVLMLPSVMTSVSRHRIGSIAVAMKYWLLVAILNIEVIIVEVKYRSWREDLTKSNNQLHSRRCYPFLQYLNNIYFHFCELVQLTSALVLYGSSPAICSLGLKWPADISKNPKVQFKNKLF